ncbi:MAG: NAD(P)H-dependent oxidoreductase [Rhodobacteraceae bacterium]|nr:NAD(P)H-dependent oxidoreductase [Paracoccaceae bacterium]
MSSLLIIFHSRTGGAQQMAEAAYAGASEDGAARLLRAEDAGPEDLLAAGGYVFCAPENLATVSGEMKAFFDRCYYPVLDRIEGRAYAVMVCAGSDGQGAVRQMNRIASGWRLKEVQPPLIICTKAQTPDEILAPKSLLDTELAQCRTIGAAMAAGLSMGIF